MNVTSYQRLKSISKQYNGDIWPNYNDVSQQKWLCRPSRDAYFIGEIEAVMPLKVLAELTVDRLLMIPSVNHEMGRIKEASEPGVVPTLEFGDKIGTDT